MLAIPLATPAIAQERGRYSLTGDVALTTRLERQSQTGSPETETLQFRQGYSLGATGPIYDARLASFTLTGAVSHDLIETDPGPDRRLHLQSLFSSVSLLAATRFPLGLRFNRSEGESDGITTTGTSYGATWTANFETLPTLQLSYDRSQTESEQLSGTQTLMGDSGRVRLSKRFARSSYEGEYERRTFSDDRGFSQTGDHGRFSSYHQLAPAWSVSTSALADREDRGGTFGGGEAENVALSGSLSYLPDPDLSATGALQFSRSDVGGRFSQSEGASARATRRFRPLTDLEANAFTSGSLNRTESSFLPGSTFWSGGLGGNLISTQLRALRAGAGYSLDVSRGAAAAVAPGGVAAVGPPEAGALQAAHRVNLNLASRTLDPYALSGDYTFVLEQGALDRQTHTAMVLGTGTPSLGLSFRALLQGSLTDDPVVKVAFLDLGVTYSPLFNLSLTSGASASLVEAGGQSTFITRIPVILRYQPERLTTLFLEGFREDIASTGGPDRISHEARLRLERPFRRLHFALELRFRDSQSGDNRTRSEQIMFTVSRPFGIGF